MENLELLKIKIKEIQELLGIHRMPTIHEIRNHKYLKIEPLINKLGGLKKSAKLLNLETKITTVTLSEQDIEAKLIELVNVNNLKRMPVSSEVLSFGGHRLHNGVIRKGGYKYFAEKLNLELKNSETTLGNKYEDYIFKLLESKNLKVESMSTGHPYDLLINYSVKVDVKVSNLSIDNKNNKAHTFGLNKKNASCDLYICICLDEEKNISKLLVIPSHHVKIVTLCIGQVSKYDKYIDRFDLLEKYIDFHNSIDN